MFEAWFEAALTPTGDGCREWRLRHDRNGYGVVKRARFRDWHAHRVAWTLVHGPIPPGLKVLHHCDNPPCCEPTHLFLGTTAVNHADMMAKHRHPQVGDAHWARRQPERWAAILPLGWQSQAKLDEPKVRAIRAARADGAPIKLLAEQYGVSVSMIANVVHFRAWADVH